MSIPNSIKGLWHCCKSGLSLLSLCLQAVGLICSHICKICSCILHLGRASQPLNQHLELQNLGLIPAEPEQRVALQAGSKALAFLWEHPSWGAPELPELRTGMCRGAKGRAGPLLGGLWHCCVPHFPSSGTGHQTLLQEFAENASSSSSSSGHAWPKKRVLCAPSTTPGRISPFPGAVQSKFIFTTSLHLPWSKNVTLTPALQAVLQT